MKTLLLAVALALPVSPVLADPNSNNPYEYTCGDLMAAMDSEDRVRLNMMLMWSIGYMYGRFDGGPDGPLNSENFDSSVTDVVNAFKQICPNIPDMPVGEFMGNLGNDLEASVEAE